MAAKTITIDPITVKRMQIEIAGDGELILNCMDNVTRRDLWAKQMNNAKIDRKKGYTDEELCEKFITSIHWQKALPDDIDFSRDERDILSELLEINNPCITGFGIYKSMQAAINHNGFDKNSKGLQSTVNVLENLIPITYATYYTREPIIQSFNGTFCSRQHTFSGWKASFAIDYNENRYTAEQIINIVKYAGFGEGIGSGRSCGFGKFHIESIAGN